MKELKQAILFVDQLIAQSNNENESITITKTALEDLKYLLKKVK